MATPPKARRRTTTPKDTTNGCSDGVNVTVPHPDRPVGKADPKETERGPVYLPRVDVTCADTHGPTRVEPARCHSWRLRRAGSPTNRTDPTGHRPGQAGGTVEVSVKIESDRADEVALVVRQVEAVMTVRYRQEISYHYPRTRIGIWLAGELREPAPTSKARGTSEG